MVTRTRLNDMLYVRCLSCLFSVLSRQRNMNATSHSASKEIPHHLLRQNISTVLTGAYPDRHPKTLILL
jgi:hypothetical protein